MHGEMNVCIGVDVGAVSVNAALLIPSGQVRPMLERIGSRASLHRVTTPADGAWAVWVTEYRRTHGRPLESARQVVGELTALVGVEHVAGVVLTGSGSPLLSTASDLPRCNEFQAVARAVNLLHPQVRTVFEIGGETSKYLRLEPDPGDGALGIADYSTNGDCAAGTGAFLDQQASRLNYSVEDFARVVAEAEHAAQIAGRCSVFAKSDMIHAQQKGFTPPEVLRGLCNAVAMNFKSAVVKGRAVVPPIVLVGGVSANGAVVRALYEAFSLDEQTLFVPEASSSFGAIGAAVVAGSAPGDQPIATRSAVERLVHPPAVVRTRGDGFDTSPPLTLERVTLLRDRTRPYRWPQNGTPVEAYLGLDIGSVGTKLVVIDAAGEVIHSIFTRTEGRPIEVVARCLREIDAAVGSRVRIRGVGSTGSGRELIGELVGADSINDEITAHKTGATFIGDRLLGKRPDTIFEIGGQDSKYISLEPEGNGSAESIVVDFTMNDACAAGTGSFLEERAEELGVSIKDEFAEMALGSQAPLRLGERCTVFMERDVNTCMQRGARREDVIAGLAYSIAYNYINRVVRGRRIGECVFFQGGTAYNDAVAAAFSAITGKPIIVPPHNAELGAIGAALLAKERVTASAGRTRFRGYDLSAVDYTLREFTCHGCGNQCCIQEFKVEDEKTFWGDKCSERFRKRSKTGRKAAIPDLVALRHELLHADDDGDPAEAVTSIGVPRAMYTFDLLPLWRRFFRACGFRVLVSQETHRDTVRRGLDAAVAEPCFPIIVAHGHVCELVEAGADYLWLPNLLSAETRFLDNESHVCPWGQTLPFVIRQAPRFRSWPGRILCPTIRLREGIGPLREVMLATASGLGVRGKRAARAFEAGLADLQRFRAAYLDAGREALCTLERTGEPGIVLVGRPYNIHDAGVSLSVARKLREQYGVNVLPIDALPLADIDVREVNENMYWEYGRRILAAAKLVGRRPNLHMIYITNFKCGPDSFVKAFVRPASGKPFLTLQFDGHSNDAGMMTRCEAYLDSKGILRWWRPSEEPGQVQPSKAGRSTSRKWPTPVPG